MGEIVGGSVIDGKMNRGDETRGISSCRAKVSILYANVDGVTKKWEVRASGAQAWANYVH
jgi:hypothetical protein